jgi:hypothetical protein
LLSASLPRYFNEAGIAEDRLKKRRMFTRRYLAMSPFQICRLSMSLSQIFAESKKKRRRGSKRTRGRRSTRTNDSPLLIRPLSRQKLARGRIERVEARLAPCEFRPSNPNSTPDDRGPCSGRQTAPLRDHVRSRARRLHCINCRPRSGAQGGPGPRAPRRCSGRRARARAGTKPRAATWLGGTRCLGAPSIRNSKFMPGYSTPLPVFLSYPQTLGVSNSFHVEGFVFSLFSFCNRTSRHHSLPLIRALRRVVPAERK